jgi:hypothetical protein
MQAANDRARVDNPNIRCLPAGVPRLVAYQWPYKILHTPGLIVVLYESGTMFRQIFTDGRMHPKDPEPALRCGSPSASAAAALGRWTLP